MNELSTSMGRPVRACLAAFDEMRAAPTQASSREFVSAFEAQQPALLEAAGIARDGASATSARAGASAPASSSSDRVARLSAEFATRVRNVLTRCAQARDSSSRS